MVRTRGGKLQSPRRRSRRLMADEDMETIEAEVEAEAEVNRNQRQRRIEPEAEANRNSPDAELEDVPQPKPKRNNKKQKKKIVEDIEEDREPLSGDDCEVVGDEDCDDVRYADKEQMIVAEGVPEADYEGDEGLEEEICVNFEAEFGIGAREEDIGDETDADSGDDIWDDERIPEPLSHSDDEDVPEEEEDGVPREYEDPEDSLRLGKTFKEDLKESD
ncbi:hypothetical protein AALP_AAs74140U000100 [Arabis alpina]|uniref:Uncharacterized protein n=1 Tax=Arabis alpina TaxID=50452 RepID=A0A087FYU1_ARAAL|nr:hypothetical protein AALP_AAs74140U000100 [Arabis alpina]